ncbi:MAG TPA: hypothetical protein VN442_23245 [Bryobacteraceae bacterium]|nr:hypothetical protein [Bryobacteraceae bacterium]
MRSFFQSLLPAALLLACAQAQTPVPAPEPPIEWDVRAVLKEISAHANRLVPLIDQIDPEAWKAKGAPDAYVGQKKSARAQAQALATEAAALTKDPEKLSEAMKVFFRIQSLEFMMNSLADGVRKYQNPAVADLLLSVSSENGANRERFQRFIVELTARREQEYEIMDHEAQRCRSVLTRETPGKTMRKSP